LNRGTILREHSPSVFPEKDRGLAINHGPFINSTREAFQRLRVPVTIIGEDEHRTDLIPVEFPGSRGKESCCDLSFEMSGFFAAELIQGHRNSQDGVPSQRQKTGAGTTSQPILTLVPGAEIC